jgi:hypothetical protein
MGLEFSRAEALRLSNLIEILGIGSHGGTEITEKYIFQAIALPSEST